MNDGLKALHGNGKNHQQEKTKYQKFTEFLVPKWKFIPAKMLSMNAVIPETQQDKKESGDLLISPCNAK